MPPKRKYENAKTRKITSWLRSTRQRTGRRANVASFRRKRVQRRMGRSRRGARRRISSYRKRSKGSSSLSKLTRILAPVSTWQYQVAGRALVPANSVAGISYCRWFVPEKAGSYSLGYPNHLDTLAMAYTLNDNSNTNALTGVNATDLQSLDMKFLTSNYLQSTKIVNQCNAQCIIHYHVIELRRDLPFWTETASTEAFNILNLLGNGFYQTALSNNSNTGINLGTYVPSSNADSTNTGLVESSYTIFNSGPFLHYFKVKKVSRHIMNAGDIKVFTMSHKGAVLNRPALYAKLEAGTNNWSYDQNQPLFSFLKGAQFQLFKLVGTPVNSAAVKNYVNLSSPAVDFHTTVSLKFQAVVKTGGVNIKAANYNISAFTDPVIMGEQTDSPLAVVNA